MCHFEQIDYSSYCVHKLWGRGFLVVFALVGVRQSISSQVLNFPLTAMTHSVNKKGNWQMNFRPRICFHFWGNVFWLWRCWADMSLFDLYFISFPELIDRWWVVKHATGMFTPQPDYVSIKSLLPKYVHQVCMAMFFFII